MSILQLREKAQESSIPGLSVQEALRYKELSDTISQMEKEKKKLNDKIKKSLNSASLTEAIIAGYKFRLVSQDRSKMNPDRTVIRLKEQGLVDCIKIVESVNEDALEQAIYEGKISQAQLQDCIDVNVIMTLRVDKVKEEGEESI